MGVIERDCRVGCGCYLLFVIGSECGRTVLERKR